MRIQIENYERITNEKKMKSLKKTEEMKRRNERCNGCLHLRIMSIEAKWKVNETPFMYEFRCIEKNEEKKNEMLEMRIAMDKSQVHHHTYQ